MVSTKILRFLLALAAVAILSFFASPADAKVRQCMIGGIPHYTAGEDGQPIKATSWAKKGNKVVTLTWANTAKTAVKVKIERLPGASAPVTKKIQVKKAQQKKQSNSKASKTMRAMSGANFIGTAFQPVQPSTFWSRLWQGAWWIFTGEWNCNKPVIIPKPAAIQPPPATTQVVPPAKPLKVRVKKRGPPESKPCEQDEIEVMKLTPPASKPPMQTVVAPPAGSPKPALGQLSAITSEPNRLLTDWEVRKKTYQITKDGKKELVKDYLRSPAECFDRVKPGYKKSGNEYTVRYDRHKYDFPTEKSVEPGTIAQYALDPKPGNLTMNHITRDAGEKMEILDVALGQFVMVDKPRAEQVEYLTPDHKRFKIVRVMPSNELYEFTEKHRVTDAELEKVRAQYKQIGRSRS